MRIANGTSVYEAGYDLPRANIIALSVPGKGCGSARQQIRGEDGGYLRPMGLANVSSKRSILSYYKVQKAISGLIRGKRVFVPTSRVRDRGLLNIGCGARPDPRFVNLDYIWLPGVDVCWDLTNGA